MSEGLATFHSKQDCSNQNALVLGGGGLWGLAHIGVLKFLQEKKIPIHAITGASMGAVVGVIAAAFIDKNGLIMPEGIKYMERVVKNVRCYADFAENVQQGETSVTRLALHRLLQEGGKNEYKHLMEFGPAVPYAAQVTKRMGKNKINGQFLSAAADDRDTEMILDFAMASAANGPMFGLDPVEVNGIECVDDTSIAYKSISKSVEHTRREFSGINVIGSALSFADSGSLVRKMANLFTLWQYSDLGDVILRPKQGHQLFDGAAALSNWKKGWQLPFMGQKYHRTKLDILNGNGIDIPVQDFMDAGYEAAAREQQALLALKE